MTCHEQEEKVKLSLSASLVLTAVFISNIGNGMNTITVGRALYDKTGNVLAFGIVIIIQYFINSLMYIFSGTLVDRHSPKLVCILADVVRGIFICIASFFVLSQQGQWWIFVSVIVINIITPFYNSATFALAPVIAPGPTLIRYNTLFVALLQAGQLIGTALVGFILEYFHVSVSFGLDGLSYLLSAIVIGMAYIPRVDIKLPECHRFWLNDLYNDWREIRCCLRLNTALFLHIILCAGDFLAVNFINLSYVPMVTLWYGNNNYWLSIFDGSFAIGAILATFIAPRIMKYRDVRVVTALCLGLEALFFACLSAVHIPYVTIIAMLGLGISNASSIIILMTYLQRRIVGPIKGRIAAIRQLIISLFTVALIPFISYAYSFSVNGGLLLSGVVCFVFSGSLFMFSRQRFFGYALLEDKDISSFSS
ncbi:MFS transporter [Dictyobacter arantiisoli]|uniref:Permease n=1 Tax=Dictyobacter arantiisoli TaxID=2014874 RepID=A0A5A5T9B6_9CHLR|nr:MFS transporter [Dictyobacter arantiisoli]GCF08002.1 permease [Dictyobacter arantiisoli]